MEFNLLVIDDDRHLLSLVSDHFSRPPNSQTGLHRIKNVVVLDTGELALEYVVETRPEVIMTDMCLHEDPEFEGLNLVRQLRALNPACKIIVMTGEMPLENDKETEREILLSSGGNRFLRKPLDLSRLGSIIGECYTAYTEGVQAAAVLLLARPIYVAGVRLSLAWAAPSRTSVGSPVTTPGDSCLRP